MPVSTVGPDSVVCSSPCDASAEPEIATPKMPAWVKFQAKCKPIGSHSERVAT
ncbi:hypothetical protein [Kibdelosporangium phytohabitans]|uniref:hypothetical protein n=1 Tax=Kibdelosporangium phytohabitans TaxID=860235 RepID=UPI0012FB73E5|nr:hypothetical protein [Kibdelosporangium phytohabitans]MBE1468238.1 hypothetical protein [Kibdelosporangium phytohabitans]